MSCPDFRAAGSDGQVAQIETAAPKIYAMPKTEVVDLVAICRFPSRYGSENML